MEALGIFLKVMAKHELSDIAEAINAKEVAVGKRATKRTPTRSVSLPLLLPKPRQMMLVMAQSSMCTRPS